MKNDFHPIQSSILKKLGYNGRRTFSELKGDYQSNKVSFHINQLQDEDLIRKDDKLYELTSLGREILPYIELENSRHPIVVVNLTVYKEDQVYLQEKVDPLDPFSGDYRVITSRVGKGAKLEKRAIDLYTNRFDKRPEKLEKAGVFDSKVTFSDGSIQHYLLFYFRAEYAGDDDENFYNLDEIGDMPLITGLDRVITEIKEFGQPTFIGNWDLQEKQGRFVPENITFR